MRITYAFDDEPPGSPDYGRAPVTVHRATRHDVNRVYASLVMTGAVTRYQETGDLDIINNAIAEIQGLPKIPLPIRRTA